MTFRQQIRNGFLRFLKNYFNPMTKRIAKGSHGPFALIRHVGRRTGSRYETPIIVQPTTDGFMIELTYGSQVDWYKNALAAGGCTLLWHGKEYSISTIEPTDTETGRAAFPFPLRTIIYILGMKHFVKLAPKK